MTTLGERIKELVEQKVLVLPADHDRRGVYYMTIVHEAPAHEGNEPVVFAALGGFTCSICAPTRMTKVQVEEFAATQFPGQWKSIDKSEFGMGSPTPNPCNQAPDRRTHWFMMWVDA